MENASYKRAVECAAAAGEEVFVDDDKAVEVIAAMFSKDEKVVMDDVLAEAGRQSRLIILDD